MIRKKKDLVTNYTESDLRSFEVLGNFDNYAFDSTNEDNKQHINQSVRYTLSDNMQFKQLMNINTNTKTYSKQYSVSNVYNYDDLTFTTKPKYNDSFYKTLDIKNFKKLPSIPQSNTKTSVYPKRNPDDSELDPQKTIAEQFNLIRIADENRYPCFFYFKGQRYKLSIRKY